LDAPDSRVTVNRLVHELGNLLALTLGQAEHLMYEEGSITPDERRECLVTIRSAALRGRDILRSLQEAPPSAASRAPSVSPAASPSPRRLLVIDDDLRVRAAVASLLRTVGHEVETAASGAEGIERCRTERFDCVFTDMEMSGLNGVAVSRAVKAHDPQVYVVLLSGSEPTESPDVLDEAGVDHVLTKPVTLAELLRVIDGSKRRQDAPGRREDAPGRREDAPGRREDARGRHADAPGRRAAAPAGRDTT